MKLIKKIVKWSAVGGALGAAYGLGVTNTLKKAAKDKPFYRRFSVKGKK